MKSSTYETVAGLSVNTSLRAFVDNEVLPGAQIEPAVFWAGLAEIVRNLAPRHHELLAIRNDLQRQIDTYHKDRKGKPRDPAEYEAFLRDIGYLQPAPAADAYRVATKNTDSEIGTVAGPQLVVPVSNARYALKAANARWGSLYDCLYGTDVLPGKFAGAFDAIRAERVITWTKDFLDRSAPLADGSHADASGYTIEHGRLAVTLSGSDRTTGLKHPHQLAGFAGPQHAPTKVLLVNHGLHIELVFDGESQVGKLDKAQIADVVLESALSTIMDLEDSVATVDAEAKVAAYRNWQKLMDGSLSAEIKTAQGTVERQLASDRIYTCPAGGTLTLHGRALMLIRNVGHHLFTDAVLDETGQKVPEGILDAAITVASALTDIRGETKVSNSRTGSVYVVKPKMHGPDEVGLTDALFKGIEDLLGLPRYTMKIGLMDEERRTSVNLAACLSKVRDRTFFINTGFLDRTGDEIHTSMEAGPMVRKDEMKTAAWIGAYERNNVEVGLARNLSGRAQIGKGMWTAPDRMAAMLDEKAAHPRSGATTAWVPNPTAATLHALHYHDVDVSAVQDRTRQQSKGLLQQMLTIPLADRSYSSDEIAAELDNNLQGLLGYVVRWVGQGVGCSTVPDLNGVRLMEDRATLRISAQHIANWLHHGIITEPQVRDTMRRMAEVVDQQNAGTEGYRPMAPGFDGPEFRAAEDLVFKGLEQPNGYTENILYEWRRAAKIAGA